MSKGVNVVIHPVGDLAAARDLYRTLLGVEPYMDQPYYVGFRVDGNELGLDPHGRDQGLTGPVAYWEVDDVHDRVRALVDAGAELLRDVQDVGGGKLIVSVRDADGNVFGLIQVP